MEILKINNVVIGKEVKIAIPIMAATQEELLEQVKKINNSPAHIVEWRIDYFFDRNNILNTLKSIKQNTNKLILVTFRRKEEGGVSTITLKEYEHLLHSIIVSNDADIVDVELSVGNSIINHLRFIANHSNTKLLYSAHFFSNTPTVKQMIQILTSMEELQADLTKLAVMPSSMEDVLNLLQVTNCWNQQATVPFITIAMGELGKITRYSGHLFGSSITFASMNKTSAPGQIEVEQLQKILDLI